MNKILILALGTIAFVALSIILTVFQSPTSDVSTTIEEFQTLIVGFFTIVVLAISVFGIYEAAEIPVHEAREERESKTLALRKAGAAVLYADLMGYVVRLIKEIGKSKETAEIVTIPRSLLDINTLATQEGALVAELADYVRFANKFNWVMTRNQEANGEPEVSLEDFRKTTMSLKIKLASIASIPRGEIKAETEAEDAIVTLDVDFDIEDENTSHTDKK